jgi:hypothetical protein
VFQARLEDRAAARRQPPADLVPVWPASPDPVGPGAPDEPQMLPDDDFEAERRRLGRRLPLDRAGCRPSEADMVNAALFDGPAVTRRRPARVGKSALAYRIVRELRIGTVLQRSNNQPHHVGFATVHVR